MARIYLAPPYLKGREKELLLKAVDSNWITTLGPQVDAFERELCEKIGVQHGVALASGTAALHLALLALGVTRGDDVICSDLTFVATANAIRYCGGVPVFIDSSESTWNMDPGLLEEELWAREKSGKRARAVLVVDLYGQCASYEQILKICNHYRTPVLEDSAEALGATYADKYSGSLGVMGVFSFNGNKIITTSGGGMLVSDNPALAARVRYLATQARDDVPYYHHLEVGYNYRLSNLLAAVGRAQLESLDWRVRRKGEINRFYRTELGNLSGVGFMPVASFGAPNFWITCITVDPKEFGATNEGLREWLELHDVESRQIWKPMHLQPVYSHCRVRGGTVSEHLFERGLCLPSGAGLTNVDLERIVGLVCQFQSRNPSRNPVKATH